MMSYLLFLYALFILIGGIFGHVKAGSTASLLMGGISGVLLLICAIGMYKKRRWGAPSALVVAVVLDLFFNYRYLSTLKFMPAGLLSLLSLSIIALLIFHLKNPSKIK